MNVCEAADDGSSISVPDIHTGSQNEVPGPALAAVDILGLNQWVENLTVSVSFK